MGCRTIDEGPQLVQQFTCTGCKFLETENWKFHGENDEIDSGTDATCVATSTPRNIASYYTWGQPVPKWCPIDPIDDKLSALRYIRSRYGDLEGVAWDRVDPKPEQSFKYK